MVFGLVVVFAFLLLVQGEFWHGDLRPRAVEANIAAVTEALETYRKDVGEFPTELEGLRALRVNPGVHGWSGPYVDREIPPDPWGAPYQYRLDGGRPRVFSPEGR